MKQICLALLALGLISCQEDEGTIEQVQPQGNLTVMLNGEDYLSQFINRSAAGPDDCFVDRIILASHYRRPDGTPRMSFGIVGIPFKRGVYTIRRAGFSADRCKLDYVYANFSTIISDGDVLGDFYLPVEEEDNFIAIDAIDLEAQEVSGTFQMTFAIRLSEQHPVKKVPDAPDTIRLTEGKFTVPLTR